VSDWVENLLALEGLMLDDGVCGVVDSNDTRESLDVLINPVSPYHASL